MIAEKGPTFTVEPRDALLDVPLAIGVSGVAPGTPVTIRATMTDRLGPWKSETVFNAAADGTVDAARDAPVRGGYQGVSAMGPIWSMEWAAEGPISGKGLPRDQTST